jgi:hypothetical protein
MSEHGKWIRLEQPDDPDRIGAIRVAEGIGMAHIAPLLAPDNTRTRRIVKKLPLVMPEGFEPETGKVLHGGIDETNQRLIRGIYERTGANYNMAARFEEAGEVDDEYSDVVRVPVGNASYFEERTVIFNEGTSKLPLSFSFSFVFK